MVFVFWGREVGGVLQNQVATVVCSTPFEGDKLDLRFLSFFLLLVLLTSGHC